MNDKFPPTAIDGDHVPPHPKPTHLPAELLARLAGRDKHPLGEVFGLRTFGVNRTRLAPGAVSSLRHAHTRQDEFVYVLHGHPTLLTDQGRTLLAPGMCAGFPAGTGNAHQLINETEEPVVYLEVGDCSDDDSVSYPDDDLRAAFKGGAWVYTRKDGRPL